jgi:hypothetical protein
MKKSLIFMILFSLFFCCNTYADDFSIDGDISEVFPEPPGLLETVRFEPDPEDWDNDGLKNEEEEYYGTDPYDPDSDNDGILDLIEITNGTNPNSNDTTGYLEVTDLATGKKDTKSSEDIIDINDQSPLPPGAEYDFPLFPWDDETYLPKVIDDKELENIDEYTGIVPPELENEEYLSFSKDDANDSISKDNLNDLVDEETNQKAMLNGASTGSNLIPILTLLLLDEDTDSDGLLDTWEMEHFGTLAYDADDDPDADNLSNLGEANNHTDPNNPDSDGDGLTDGFEVLNGINPNDTDSDDDSLNDGYEITNSLDPLDPDMDDDGLTDGAEIAAGTNPQDSDTDHDDLPDLWEVNSGTNPLVYDRNNDLDSDLYTNYVEYILDTDPDNVSSSPIPGYHHKYDDKGRLTSSIYLKNYQIEYDIRYTYDMTGNRATRVIR